MTRQDFDTANVLRLEVEEAPTGAVNLISNPNGDLGSWGWITPIAASAISAITGGLRFAVTAAGAFYFATERKRMTAGHYAAGRIEMVARSGALITWRARFVFLDASGTVISSGAQTADTGLGVLQIPGAQAPVGTVYVQLRLDVYRSAGNLVSGSSIDFANGVVITAPTSAGLGAPPRVNAWPSPSYEGGNGGFLAPGGSAAARSADWAQSGAQSVKVTVTSAGAITARVYLGRYDTLGTSTGGNAGPTSVVEPGATYKVSLYAKLLGGNLADELTLWLVALSGTEGTSSAAPQAQIASAVFSGAGEVKRISATITIPAGCEHVQLRVDRANAGLGNGFYVDAILLEKGDTLGAYFDGNTPDAGGTDYAWTGTAGESPSTATTVATLPYIPPITWLSILGAAQSVVIERDELDVSTLTGQIVDASLDPSQSSILRPGRACRISALATDTAAWEPLFTGTLRRATVAYDLRKQNGRRARITLSATDAATDLANVSREESFATIDELPAVLEGAGIPWDVNGSGDQVPTAAVVARNSNASALDQLGITRDSTLGHVWVDRKNIVRAYDDVLMPAAAAGVLSEAVYTDLQIDYDTDRLINHVTIKYLRGGAAGEATEITYGPYVDQDSIDTWGAHAATFTIVRPVEDEAAIAAHAAAILAANANPSLRINGCTFSVSSAELNAATGQRRALLDLLELVTVSNDDAGLSTPLRVRTIRHTINPTRWLVDVGFVSDGQVAAPARPPEPGSNADSLLEIGRVDMFYGTKTEAQASGEWLVMDGSAFSSTDYPKLYAHLGSSALLPDWQDRVPVGASVAKPLGTAGGAEQAALTVGQLPAHKHTLSMTTAAGTAGYPVRGQTLANVTATNDSGVGNTGNGDPVSRMQPWRALHFRIKAR